MSALAVPREAVDELVKLVIGTRDALSADENIRLIATPVAVAVLRHAATCTNCEDDGQLLRDMAKELEETGEL